MINFNFSGSKSWGSKKKKKLDKGEREISIPISQF